MRYLILLMGIFAFYNGWIYNELFAIPLDTFGTCYQAEAKCINFPAGGVSEVWGYAKINTPYDDCVYPVGIDPRWGQASNMLTFTNNFKMKIAVIFAILQMSLGIFMRGVNNIYFRQKIDFIFEFIPQILLLWVLFGWMDALIIGKWLTPKNIEL